jgi:hypothetical protein
MCKEFEKSNTPLEILYSENNAIFIQPTFIKNTYAIGTDNIKYSTINEDLKIGLAKFTNKRPKFLIDFLAEKAKDTHNNPLWSKISNREFINEIITKVKENNEVYVYCEINNNIGLEPWIWKNKGSRTSREVYILTNEFNFEWTSDNSYLKSTKNKIEQIEGKYILQNYIYNIFTAEQNQEKIA